MSNTIKQPTKMNEEITINKKTIHFYIQDTPTLVNDVKLFAEVKYATIGGEVINIEDGKIWNLIKKDRVFQRRFDKDKDDKKVENEVPNSSYATIVR